MKTSKTKSNTLLKPHRSFYDIPVSNGFSSAKFNTISKTIDSFKNHIYSNINETESSVNLIEYVDFKMRFNNNTEVNISNLKLCKIGYLNGTGIINAEFEYKKNKITAYIYSSFLKHNNNLTIVITGKYCSVVPEIKINPVINPCESGNSFFFTDKGRISVSQVSYKKKYAVSINHFHNEETVSDCAINVSPEKLLNEEINFWKQWHKKSRYPEKLTKPQKILYSQSLAVLKMGQCREKGKSYGQILASLPPGMWNICWIRDASYAINGLIYAGHYKEAKEALNFFLDADCGKYIKFKVDEEEVGLKIPYQISVCRYFGNGTEESDGGNDPNIELDGFGLFLWTLENYIKLSGDIEFLKKNWGIISEKIADVLIVNIDYEKNVIRRESSIWERHIRSNGKENGMKYFTYTNITAIKGLRASSYLAELIGNKYKQHQYSNAAETLISGFMKHQVDEKSKIVKNSIEKKEVDSYVDGSVVESINFEIIEKKSKIAQNTISAFDNYLKMKNRDIGYFRNCDGTHYDNQEWVVIDLRIAAALKKMGYNSKSKKIIKWITDQSKKNYNIIAELYNETTADYEGAVPMCGFGPGAYILTLW
ncbi:glycoside hydrolase family 15 protein [Candidatus Dependentiae bacterium]|nr:glycoside hydrolase family 15 protein [Candidatus Dependentiae bacterium]